MAFSELVRCNVPLYSTLDDHRYYEPKTKGFGWTRLSGFLLLLGLVVSYLCLVDSHRSSGSLAQVATKGAVRVKPIVHAPRFDPIGLLDEEVAAAPASHQHEPNHRPSAPHNFGPQPQGPIFGYWISGAAACVLAALGGAAVGRQMSPSDEDDAPARSPASYAPAIVAACVIVVGPALFFLHGDAPAAAADAATAAVPPTAWEILNQAFKRAVGGGRAGAAAAVVQVLSLMWLRTAMNYQYRYGGKLPGTLSRLWKEGGVPRLYQGLPFAILQGPLARFGDTAATVGVSALFASSQLPLPIAAQTLVASGLAGTWRIFLTPVDTFKTAVQVNGPEGARILRERMSSEGFGVLYNGALAAAVATVMGHYPWFLTYNTLVAALPPAPELALAWAIDPRLAELLRSALVGFTASSVSDCVSNAARVLKTTKQTCKDRVTYLEALRLVLKEDGVPGLLWRGLETRLLCNGLQGMLFTVVWRYLQSLWV